MLVLLFISLKALISHPQVQTVKLGIALSDTFLGHAIPLFKDPLKRKPVSDLPRALDLLPGVDASQHLLPAGLKLLQHRVIKGTPQAWQGARPDHIGFLLRSLLGHRKD